jgi:PAS domain-containing protein
LKNNQCKFSKQLRTKRGRIRSRVLVWLILATLLCFPAPSHVYARTTASTLQVVSLAEQTTLKTIIIDQYEPYTFVNAEGKPDGFSVDLMQSGLQVMAGKLERLNQGLSIFKATGLYHEIYKKWFVAREPAGATNGIFLEILGMSILAVLLVGAMLLLWSFSLRKQVAVHTQSLQNEIRERLQAEETLRQKETLLRSVLETMPVGVWIMDRTGQIVQGNLAGQKIWAGARYVGPSEFDQYKGWWVDTGQLIQADEWAAVRAVKSGETSLDEVIEIECFDGTRKTILNSAVPLREAQGEITGAIVINQDITERKLTADELKASEERYRGLITNLDAGIVVHAADTSIIKNNSKASELLGLSEDQMKGKLAIDPNWKFIQKKWYALTL